MAKPAWAEPTKELRNLFPDVEGLRLRSANRGGKSFNVTALSHDGRSKKARQAKILPGLGRQRQDLRREGVAAPAHAPEADAGHRPR